MRERSECHVLVRLVVGILVCGAPVAAHGEGKLRGDPGSNGVIAIDCTVRIVDQSLSERMLAHFVRDSLWNSTSIICRPWLVRLDRPKKKSWLFNGRIGPRGEGGLFFFSGLEPGLYRVDVVIGSVSERDLPGGGKSDDFRTLEYGGGADWDSLLTVDLSAGAVRYLGDLTIFDARFQKSVFAGGADYLGVRYVIARRQSDALRALQLLTKADRHGPWEAVLSEARQTVNTASVRDTTFEW